MVRSKNTARAKNTPRSKNAKKRKGTQKPDLAVRLRRSSLVLGEACLWLLLASVWWYHDTQAKDAFRLPKQVLSQSLILASLFPLAWRLRDVPRLSFRHAKESMALLAVVPFLVVALLGLMTTSYPLHLLGALVSLGIGSAALVVWSLALPGSSLQRLISGIVAPGVASALVGILQYHGIWRPFDFAGELESQRIGVTSFAGSAGDLAVFLVLPCLIAQQRWAGSAGRWRWVWGGSLAICVYAMAVTQTLSALVALVVGSLVFWLRFSSFKRVAAAVTLFGIGAGLLIVTLAPLRERVASKARFLARGQIDEVLTGRLDGWKGAWWMLSEHPITGVGLGGYRAEFATAKLALVEEGTQFFRGQHQVMFVNAHNEYLEVAAELGWLGVLALAWGLWILFRGLRRMDAAALAATASAATHSEGALVRGQAWRDSALAWSGVFGLAVCSLAQFPFRLAMVAFPAILFLAWIFSHRSPQGEEATS